MIDAGKHVFCEKPVAVDAPGVRNVLETVKMAKDKNVSLVAGFCWRYSNFISRRFDQVHERIDRRHRCLLRDLLHQPGEADAAGKRAAGGHERCRVADQELVQLRLALRRQPGGAGRTQRRQSGMGDEGQASRQLRRRRRPPDPERRAAISSTISK